MLYERLDRARVQCNLCAHRCIIRPGKRGVCQVRENRGGRLMTLTYERLCACNVDPIEKKPLFHFYPGSRSLSIATVGCNFQCSFCQNYTISQAPRLTGRVEGEAVSPASIVEAAQRSGSKSISYTYTEPTVFFEYAYETARLARPLGIKNCFVSNGYMTEEALEAFHPYLDAINVDLKGFNEPAYKRVIKARLEPVVQTLKVLKRLGVWVEVTTLIIPGLNDSTEELTRIAEFLADLDPAVPWHLSRFWPHYKMLDVPPTPVETIFRACSIGKEAGLKYVYTGNIPEAGGENTACSGCSREVIVRHGYYVAKNVLAAGACPFCGTPVEGVGM